MADVAPWHVRIFGSSEGVPAGAGVYIGEQKIVTCAHVIGDALGLADVTTRPTDHVWIDFPQSRDRKRRRAQVIGDDAWFPERDEAGDLAMLKIVGEDASREIAAPLRLVGSPTRRTIEVLGHPSGHTLNGVWARARLIGPAGPNIEWIQMDTPTLTGKRIEPGFSGAGVIDEEDGTVIGCVVAVDTTAQERVAWMIPTEIMVEYWPGLLSMCRPAPTGKQRRRREQGDITQPSEPQWHRVAALLHTLSSIRRREDRLLHISRLEREFGGRLYIERGNIDSGDGDYNATFAIVSACTAHPGALHSLVEQLDRFQLPEDADIFPAIVTAVEAVDPSPLLISEERNHLYRLLDAIDPHVRADMVIRSYREAVPPVGQSKIDPLDLPSVVRGLEAATSVLADLPPLIHFIEVICRQLPAAKVADLHEWVDDVARREPIDQGQIARLRLSTPPPSSPVASYFLTEVMPDGADSERYLPRITLQQSAQPDQLTQGLLLYPPEDRMSDPVLWSEIPALFDSALSEVWASSGLPVNDLVVEFLLPFPLLSEPVDQWDIERSGAVHVVGIDHVVVVRIWDRVSNQYLLNRSMPFWQEKSSRLNSDGAGVLWINPGDSKYVTRKLYADLTPNGEPCLGLDWAPQLPLVPGNDAVSIGIRAGVPAMIWCRNEDLAPSFLSCVGNYLAHHNLSGLPDFILQLRRESVRTDDLVGANITLIWDPADGRAIASRQAKEGGQHQ